MRMKANIKMIRNMVVFIALVIFTFWFVFKDQDMNELFNSIKSANILYLSLGALLMLGYFLIESYNIRSMLIAFGDKKIPVFKALKFTLIGFFFSSITPAATGGQPVEIYYMTKEGISGAKATMTSLVVLCSFQISTISYGIICSIINPSLLSGGIVWVFLLGLLINGTALAFLLICIFSEKLTRKLVNLAIIIMEKMKLKNIEKRREEINKELKKYNGSAKYIKAHMGAFIKAILRGFVQIGLYYSVPFCVYKALGLSSYNYFQIFVMQAVLYNSVSGLPLPGAVGVSETIFLKIFRHAFGAKLISASMLLSRTVTFYLYVIISLVVVIINAVKMKGVKGEIDRKVIKIEKDYEVSNKNLVAT